jgi:membrane-associated phospholipid phosphatase
MSPASVSIPRPLWVGLALLATVLLLGAGIAFGLGEHPWQIDAAWQDFVSTTRGPVMLAFSYGMNFIGGGWFAVFVVPGVGAIALLIARRPWGALYWVLAITVSAGIVQVIKRVVGRARPEDILVISDYGSFPSGHVANAATIAVALFMLFPRVWVAVAGSAWVVLMAFSRTYLGAHWLSDTLGGALVGAAAALLVAAVLARPLEAEAERHSGSLPAADPDRPTAESH